MKVLIKKGRHRPVLMSWIRLIGFFSGALMQRQVIFFPSCKYILPAGDQDDVNKLFGFGFFPGHHRHSARIGWRYNTENNRIELMGYCYVNGGRVIEKLCDVMILRSYTLTIVNDEGRYSFFVSDGDGNIIANSSVEHRHSRRFGFRLAPYFGGNRAAPHDIYFVINKIK